MSKVLCFLVFLGLVAAMLDGCATPNDGTDWAGIARIVGKVK